jgi:hypothetical protein
MLYYRSESPRAIALSSELTGEPLFGTHCIGIGLCNNTLDVVLSEQSPASYTSNSQAHTKDWT